MTDNLATVKILPYTLQHKRDMQNNIVKRFRFTVLDNREEEGPLPYKVITETSSSHFFKRRLNRYIKISDINCDMIGLSKTDIINKTVKKNSSISSSFNIGYRTNILDFFNDTGIFINIYRIESDGSMTKLDLCKKYVYDKNDKYPNVVINSFNSVSIEFYDNEKYNDFILEIMTNVKSYTRFTNSSEYNKNMSKFTNFITFVDGLMYSPTNITSGSLVEVYELTDNSFISNSQLFIENGICKINDILPSNMKDSPINPDLVFIYHKNGEYKQYPNSVIVESEYTPLLKLKDSNETTSVYALILGNKELFSKEYESLYDKLTSLCSNVSDAEEYVKYIMDYELSRIPYNDEKMIVQYPTFYRRELENISKNDLYIKTIDKISKNQIETIDGVNYIKFTFNTKSMSYLIFIKGRIILPDIYQDTEDSTVIYIAADRSGSELIDTIGENNIDLLHPITFVRCKNFYNTNVRFPILSKPIYIKKPKRYDYDIEHNRYIQSTTGRYVIYDGRYEMIDLYYYDYDEVTKSYKLNPNGDYVKLAINSYTVPYNKSLEDNKYNLVFVEDLHENDGKILDDIYFTDVYYGNQVYPKSIISKFNGSIELNGGSARSYSNITNDIHVSENQHIDSIISNAISNMNMTAEFFNSKVINILIIDNDVYFILNDYISSDDNEIKCTYLTDDGVIHNDYIDVTQSTYIRDDIYDSENRFIISKTDNRLNINFTEIGNYEDLIYNITDSNNITNYDNIGIMSGIVYFFNNSDITDINYSTYIITGTFQKYDLADNVLSTVTESISYFDLGYLYADIIINNEFKLWKRGFPRQRTNLNSISLYNADTAYSKFYTNNGTDDLDIPIQLRYNYDQLMVFNSGYLSDDYVLTDKIKLIDFDTTNNNNVFVSNMSKLTLYKTEKNMKIYGGYVVEICPGLDKSFRTKEFYHNTIDVMQVPLSLDYMLIFVNGVHIDKNHIEILSDNHFMLKNLSDLPNMQVDTNTTIENGETVQSMNYGKYIINSIEIYVYPFEYNKTYSSYYNEINEYDKYNEYVLADSLYQHFLSELVTYNYKKCDTIYLPDTSKNRRLYLSDFRYKCLGEFTHNELSTMMHERGSHFNQLWDYTHAQLSTKTHEQLAEYVHGYKDDNEDGE